MNRENHVQAVQKWLDENVLVFETQESVMVSGFHIKSGQFSGSFEVSLDNVKVPERFSFGLGANGKPDVFLPMFHSPLGAPASYSAVDLTPETILAIKELLASVLPRMKALGLNRETGELIFLTTHSEVERIVDKASYEACMSSITNADFSAVVRMKAAQQAVQADRPTSGGSTA